MCLRDPIEIERKYTPLKENSLRGVVSATTGVSTGANEDRVNQLKYPVTLKSG